MLRMMFSILFLFSSLAVVSKASDSYTCPTDRQCVPLRECHHEGATIWCNDERTKICCPKRSSGKSYTSEKSNSIPKYDGGESYKSEKSHSVPKYDHGRNYKSDSYSGSKYSRDYRGNNRRNRDYYDLDYYEDGYTGPGLSHEAKRILQSYDEKECGVRRSFYGRVSTGHEVDLGITKYGEFPWQAAILLRISEYEGSGYRKAYKFLCGATVINPVLILTAAHCVKGMRISNLKVKLGEWNLRGTQGEMFPTVDRRIKSVIVHNYYNSASFEHDIALLVLSKPVNLRKTPHVAPACLPPKHTKFDEYSKCYIVGWGNDIYKPNYGSNILKVASVSLLKDDCRHKLKESIPSLSNNFFAKTDIRCVTGSFGKDACVGDGGGAVVCPLSNSEVPVCKGGYSCRDEHYFIAGIVSWGSDKCGQENSVTVVTDFDTHRDWIAEKARPYGGIDSYHDYDYDRYDYDHHDGYGHSDYSRRYDYDGYDGTDRYGYDGNRYDNFDRYDGYDGTDGYGYDNYHSRDRYDGYDYGRSDSQYDSHDHDQYEDRYDYKGGKRRDGYSYESSRDDYRHEFEKYVR